MPEGTSRSLGEYELSVHLHSDVDAQIKLVVIAE
jgi:large subunit ribosomal protein L9